MAIRRRLLLGGMLLIPAFIAGCDPTPAQSDKQSTSDANVSAAVLRAYSDYLKGQAAAGRFSGVALVAEDGRPLLAEAYGMADLKRRAANTTDTKFSIASLNKMFTAVAIAQLVEQGKLSFTDTIGKYVAGLPPEIADTVTIHHLLTHTSGMGDVALGGDPETERPQTLAGMMERIVKAPLRFEPGARFAYSNDGFIVLGSIIERVTGQRYQDYVREHILTPAGMTATGISPYRPADVPNMAHGYMQVDKKGNPVPRDAAKKLGGQSGSVRDNADVPQIANPSGGAYSTAADLLNFARALIGHRLLGKALTDTVLAGKVDSAKAGGPPNEKYGYGFSDASINGVRIVGHNGGTPGYEAQLDIYPDRGYVVVLLANQDRVLVPALQRSEEMLTR